MKKICVSKKICVLLIVVVLSLACDTGRINNNNPNIPNYTVNLEINMGLPEYYNLQFPSYAVVKSGYGARGVVVFNAGSNYVAYDLACPNQAFSTCTNPMTVNSTQATCTCDNSVYNLFSGQSPGQQYPMKPYRVERVGNYLYITN